MTADDSILSYVRGDISRLEGKLDTLTGLVTTHMTTGGHPAEDQRITTLENEVKDMKSKPLQTWQIIAGIIGLLVSLSFLLFTALNFLMGIVTFFMGVVTFFHIGGH